MCKQLFYSPQSLQRHRCLHGKMRVSLISLMQMTHSKPVSSNSFSSSCSMSNKELHVPLIWCCTETTTEADSTVLYMHIQRLTTIPGKLQPKSQWERGKERVHEIYNTNLSILLIEFIFNSINFLKKIAKTINLY